jgi:hypothetical protein
MAHNIISVLKKIITETDDKAVTVILFISKYCSKELLFQLEDLGNDEVNTLFSTIGVKTHYGSG